MKNFTVKEVNTFLTNDRMSKDMFGIKHIKKVKLYDVKGTVNEDEEFESLAGHVHIIFTDNLTVEGKLVGTMSPYGFEIDIDLGGNNNKIVNQEVGKLVEYINTGNYPGWDVFNQEMVFTESESEVKPSDMDGLMSDETVQNRDYTEMYNNLKKDLQFTVERLENLNPEDLADEQKRYRLTESLYHLAKYADELNFND